MDVLFAGLDGVVTVHLLLHLEHHLEVFDTLVVDGRGGYGILYRILMRTLFILHFSFINALPILLPVIEDIYLNPQAKCKKTATKEKRSNEAKAQRLKRYVLRRLMSICV